MHAGLNLARVAAGTAIAALLLLISGCGEKQRDASAQNPVLRSQPPVTATAAPQAPTRPAPRGPLSQAELDAIYATPAGPAPRYAAAAAATPVTGAAAGEYGVVGDASWDVRITREWRHIVVHHSASANGSLASFDRAHRERGWDGIGYHFVIGNGNGSGDGQVEPTYRWRQQLQGAHAGVAEYNQHGIGICLVGDFEHNGRPTGRQMASLRALVRFLQVKTGVPTCEVVGHGDFRCTDCPGKWLDMGAFRASLGGGAIGVPIRLTSSPASMSRPTQMARGTATRNGAALP
ncbi:MAG: peptidoglycan recognition family protein [Planctomycetota bacterium]|nr:peptidoglycan recognition family protein [Planctomycetota bacterium]